MEFKGVEVKHGVTLDDELAVAGNNSVKQVNFQLPNGDVKAKLDGGDDTDESLQMMMMRSLLLKNLEMKSTAEVDCDEDDEDESSDDNTPKMDFIMPEEHKKRSAETDASKSAGVFECNFCSKIFISEMGLKSHKKANHSAAVHPIENEEEQG